MPPPLGVAAQVDTTEIRRVFRAAAKHGIPASMKKTNKRIGDMVIAKAKPRLPVQQGTYSASLRASNTSWVAKVRAGGKRRAPYAPIIHWGSAYRPSQPPRPQISEAAQEIAPQLVVEYMRGLQRELDKISSR